MTDSPKDLDNNPFGTGTSWQDASRYIGKVLRGKFHSLRDNREYLDDVLGSVMLDLLDYWSTLPSSRTESGYYSWSRAINRGVKFGTRQMWDEIQWRQGDYSRSPVPITEDVYFGGEDEDVVLARRVLESFSYEELQEFFAGILSDTSTRADAAIYGVSHMTVARRRQAQREKLRQRAREMGLLDA